MSSPIELRSLHLGVIVHPDEGGRISSLRCLHSGLEFLLQSKRPDTSPYPAPSVNANFAQGAVAGIEECLPTVAHCQVDAKAMPDHGDFWQLPWNVHDHSSEHVLLSAEGFSQPLRFEKTLRLSGPELRLNSRITNIGLTEAPFLYATHPLLAVERGDRIILPEECTALNLYDSCKQRLGTSSQRVSWPEAQTPDGLVSLDLIADLNAHTAEMLYTDRLQEGWCGLYRTHRKQGVAVRFDADRLPYMGLWICCGGWPEEDGPDKQYAFAPEPTTAPCGTLAEALQQGHAIRLLPGESFAFSISFRVSDPEIDCDRFRAIAAADAC